MKTIDSVVVALVHGVRVDSHTSVSYGLQLVLVECRFNTTWFDLPVRLAVSMDARIIASQLNWQRCSNSWNPLDEMCMNDFGMFTGNYMRVPHYHSLYLLTGARVYGNGDTSIGSIEVERNTKV
jgi:hypothetical protein